MLEKTVDCINESVLFCGHAHKSWSKVLHNKLVINPGLVGVHFNKSKCSEYTILRWDVNEWTVSHHKVEYNLKN